MDKARQIEEAIAKHYLWKAQLRRSIDEKKFNFPLEGIATDNHCDFGKWLYSLPDADKATKEWEKIRDLHGEFHKEASRILCFVIAGDTEEAQKSLSIDGLFSTATTDLMNALTEWAAIT